LFDTVAADRHCARTTFIDAAFFVTRTPAQPIVSHSLDASATSVRPFPAEASALIASAVLIEALQKLSAPVVLMDEQLRLRWNNDAARSAFGLPAIKLAIEDAATFIAEIRDQQQQLAAVLDQSASELNFDVNLQWQGASARGTASVKALMVSDTAKILLLSVSDVRAAHPQIDRLTDGINALDQVLESLPHMLLVLDQQLHVLFANRGYEARSAAQLKGVHISELLPPEVHERGLAAMAKTLSTGVQQHYSGYVLDPEAHTRHYSVQVHPIRHDGNVIGLALHAGETTEQVNAERAIATQAQMIDSMLEGVAVIDEKGVIHITNPAFDALFGHERGTLVGRDLRTLVQPSFGEAWSGSRIGESMTVEFDARRRGGEIFSLAGVLSGFDIAGRNHSLLVLQDVSERKELERGVLQAVNREQYRIGNDLHDGLGQELTGIALMLRGLAGRLTTEYPPLLPEIEGITRLVNNAIESTRALARGLSPVNLERGGLQDALEGLAMHATELYDAQVIFTQRISGQQTLNPELANHLYRIAQEAIRNAVRHGKARSIRLHLSIARAKVKLSITDDGTGMPADAMDASGMGLKIMCYRARIVGGDVSFESVQPAGTRVLCECPLEAGGAARLRKLPKRKTRA
jgi:PAS domain S-box-containing protein